MLISQAVYTERLLQSHVSNKIPSIQAITSYAYPMQSLTSDIVRSVFSYIVVIDCENYAIVISLQNRELTPEELKKAATAKPLLQSKCKSLSNATNQINWKIIII